MTDPDGPATVLLDDATYDQLRRSARRLLGGPGDELHQATSVVHEAWLKLRTSGMVFQSRAHLLSVAGRCMRQVLVDAARAAGRTKRGGGLRRTTLSGVSGAGAEPVDVLALEDALTELEGLDPRLVEVVTLRVLLGLTVEETADALGASRRTVLRDWRFAQVWLAERLAGA